VSFRANDEPISTSRDGPTFAIEISQRPRCFFDPRLLIVSLFRAAENGKGSELELSEETVQGVLAACRQEIG